MGLRLKILSGFLILVIMLLIAGVWSIYELQKMGTSVQNILDDNYASINACKIMIESLERQDSGILLLMFGNWEEGRTVVDDADSTFREAFEFAYNNLTVENEEAYLDTINAHYDIYREIWERPIVGTAKEGNLSWYFEKIHPSFLDTKSSVEKLLTLNDRIMYRTASELRNRANRAIMPGIIAVAAALVFTLIFNLFLNYYVVSPLVRITEGARSYLDKKVPFHVETETHDEISELSRTVGQLCLMVDAWENRK